MTLSAGGLHDKQKQSHSATNAHQHGRLGSSQHKQWHGDQDKSHRDLHSQTNRKDSRTSSSVPDGTWTDWTARRENNDRTVVSSSSHGTSVVTSSFAENSHSRAPDGNSHYSACDTGWSIQNTGVRNRIFLCHHLLLETKAVIRWVL